MLSCIKSYLAEIWLLKPCIHRVYLFVFLVQSLRISSKNSILVVTEKVLSFLNESDRPLSNPISKAVRN